MSVAGRTERVRGTCMGVGRGVTGRAVRRVGLGRQRSPGGHSCFQGWVFGAVAVAKQCRSTGGVWRRHWMHGGVSARGKDALQCSGTLATHRWRDNYKKARPGQWVWDLGDRRDPGWHSRFRKRSSR